MKFSKSQIRTVVYCSCWTPPSPSLQTLPHTVPAKYPGEPSLLTPMRTPPIPWRTCWCILQQSRSYPRVWRDISKHFPSSALTSDKVEGGVWPGTTDAGPLPGWRRPRDWRCPASISSPRPHGKFPGQLGRGGQSKSLTSADMEK